MANTNDPNDPQNTNTTQRPASSGTQVGSTHTDDDHSADDATGRKRTVTDPDDCPVFGGCNILESKDRLISGLEVILRYAVKALAVLMTAVIVWGVLDVIYVIGMQLATPPFMLLEVDGIFKVFGAFMAVLISIEIFANIVVYLKSEMIHLRLVLATAMMAAARKVIVLDYKTMDPLFVLSLGGVIIALSVSFWLVHRYTPPVTDANEKAGLLGGSRLFGGTQTLKDD